MICSICCNHNHVLSSFMTYHRISTRVIQQVSLVEQGLLSLPKHNNSPRQVRFAHVFTFLNTRSEMSSMISELKRCSIRLYSHFKKKYCCWFPTRFPCHMMFGSFNSNAVISFVALKLLMLSEHQSSPLVFFGYRVDQYLSFCVAFLHHGLSFVFAWTLSVLRFTVSVILYL